MQPVEATREVSTRGKMSGASFGISDSNQAHILSILRDRLYTNKVLAVLREYSANAWDAHVEAGKADVPIRVDLPTSIEPTLHIRDFGLGLSESDVYNVYAKYGESTKRTSNAQVGMLGIGSKSAFAYSDSFTITSYNGGKRMVFIAVLDESNVGVINKLDERAKTEHLNEFLDAHGLAPLDTDEEWTMLSDVLEHEGLDALDFEGSTPEEVQAERARFVEMLGLGLNVFLESRDDTETGVEIQVPIRPADIHLFVSEASRLFPFFTPRPIINMKLEEPIESPMKTGFLRKTPVSGLPPWVAIMGCVPYRLDFRLVQEELKARNLESFTKMQGGIYFRIGDADVSASREELEYTERTRAAIVRAVEGLRDEALAGLEAVLAAAQTDLEKRINLLSFLNASGLPCPLEHVHLTKAYVDTHSAQSFALVECSAAGPGGRRKYDSVRHLHLWDQDAYEFLVKIGDNYPGGPPGRTPANDEGPQVFDPAALGVPTLVIRDTQTPINHHVAPTERVLLVVPVLPPPPPIEVKTADGTITQKPGHRPFRWTPVPEKFGAPSVSEMQAELSAFITKNQIQGIPVVLLSSLPKQSVQKVGPADIKHRRAHFQLRWVYETDKWSELWEVAESDIQAEDPVVILSRFEAVDHDDDFYKVLARDKELFENIFRTKFPTVFGVKTTKKKPKTYADVGGMPYKDWRKKAFTELLQKHPRALEIGDVLHWSHQWHLRHGCRNYDGEDMMAMAKALGKAHPLVLMMQKFQAAKTTEEGWTEDQSGVNSRAMARHLLKIVEEVMPTRPNIADQTAKAMLAKYPLFQGSRNMTAFEVLGEPSYRDHWFNYIKLVDERESST